MIIDSIQSFERYSSYYKGFEKVYDFIKNNNLHTLALGTHIIEENDIWCKIVEEKGKGVEVLPQLEAHDSFIDIFVLLEGEEMIGYKDRSICDVVSAKYDELKDLIFFEDTPEVFVNCGIDNFIICFPKDAHAPMIGEGVIKKAIFKVRIINN
jgi:biofilm protein TabA